MSFRRFRAVVCCFVFAFACSAGHAQSGPAGLSLETAVTRTIEGMTVTPASNPLRRIEAQMTRPAGAEPPISQRYESIGNNVWKITSEQSLKNGHSSSQGLSLCGLVDLAVRSDSELHFENTVSVPLGPISMPLGSEVTKKLTGGTRAILLVLGDGGRDICAPSEGEQFAFSIRAELETVHETSSRGEPKRVAYGIDMKCQAGQTRPAAELGQLWSGNYIPVTCTGKGQTSGKSSTTKYAYLVDSAFYLALEKALDAGRTTFTYTTLEFATR